MWRSQLQPYVVIYDPAITSHATCNSNRLLISVKLIYIIIGCVWGEERVYWSKSQNLTKRKCPYFSKLHNFYIVVGICVLSFFWYYKCRCITMPTIHTPKFQTSINYHTILADFNEAYFHTKVSAILRLSWKKMCVQKVRGFECSASCSCSRLSQG